MVALRDWFSGHGGYLLVFFYQSRRNDSSMKLCSIARTSKRPFCLAIGGSPLVTRPREREVRKISNPREQRNPSNLVSEVATRVFRRLEDSVHGRCEHGKAFFHR